ncbi:hypothetical protein [Rhodoblastus sp.]
MAVSHPLKFMQASVASDILAVSFVNDFSALAMRPPHKEHIFRRPE